MNILILNLILTTAEKGVITRRNSIKDTMIANFAMGFIKNGHTVTIIAADDFRPLDEEKYEFNIIYLKSRYPKIFKPSLLPFPIGLRNFLKENIAKFDLVVSSEAFSMTTLLGYDICKEKLVIWQEMALHQHFLFKLPAKIWYNIITRFITKKQLVIPRSLPAYHFIKKYHNNVSQRCVDHGSNDDLFKPINDQDNSFVIVSQLIKRKNIDKIIRNFNELLKNPKYNNYLLHIIGDGEEYQNLKRLIIQLDAENNIILHGFMEHSRLYAYIAKAKGLLIDTSQDNNMVSISESILCGTPVLTNTIPTNSSFIESNKLGVAKDNWNEQDLIEFINNYDSYHSNCIAKRDLLTNVGATKSMIEIYSNWIKTR
ncbi:MAG: glycosyltransferase family 4 protein [Muribaculaceae bacterium]